jgi:hypothetical protein
VSLWVRLRGSHYRGNLLMALLHPIQRALHTEWRCAECRGRMLRQANGDMKDLKQEAQKK